MAVENYLLSREGRKLSTKILKFMRSLIIKIETEANEEETKESYLKWVNYKYAYEESDDLFAYNYTLEDCLRFNISAITVRTKKLLDKNEAYKLQIKGDADALNLLSRLRKERIESYVETNSYYSQFQGIPRKGQEIFIANKDKQNEDDPDIIPIQEINIERYPITYEYVFISGIIDKIKEENPSYYYLRFLEDNKKSIYYVRSKEQFDILWCDESILTDVELNNFYKIYQNKKIYMQEMMYVKGFNSRMDMYPFLMELLLLQDVFMSFFNSYMDNFSLANYSDQEIFDILDSYNLSNLKNVKMTTLRKIIREIPDLIELRGSDLIIEKILDIVADNSVTIKRYYLSKVYNVSPDGQTRFDTTKTYENNIDIVFKEKIIRKGKNATEETENDYLSFTEDDDTWGGDLAGLSNEQKTKAKMKFKRELMQMDFSNILTKYLTISSTVNSYEKQVRCQNLLGLLWQWLRKNQDSNFMIDDSVTFNAYEVRPIDMYAAICWLNQWLNGIKEPEVIRINNMNIEGVIALRDTGVEHLVNDITGSSGEPIKITLPANLGDKTIIDVLGHHDPSSENQNTNDANWPYFIDKDGQYKINYKNTFISFKPNTSLSELFADYDKNIAIINALKQRWIESSTLEEAKCWDYLIQQNKTNTYFEILFDSESRFDLFIRNSNREFFNYLNITLNNDDFEAVYSLYSKLLEGFRDYMLFATEDKISLNTPNSDENESSVDYLTDLKLLFNEFLSVYTELHKIEFSQMIDDSPYNRIKLLYHYDKDIIFNDFGDLMRVGTINKDTKVIDKKTGLPVVKHKTGYGELVGEELNYYQIFDMMKENKLESQTTQLETIVEKIEDTDALYNKQMSPTEISNILSFIDEEIERIEYIRQNSIGGLSSSLASKLDLCNTIKNNLNSSGSHFYRDILSVTIDNISGSIILADYLFSEINEIKASIEEIKKRSDLLPHYKHYVEFELMEDYITKIIEVKQIKSLGLKFDPPKMLFYNIDIDSEDDFNNRLKVEYKYFEDLLETSYKDSIVIPKDDIFEHDLSFMIFFDDLIKVFIKEKILDDITIIDKKDGIKLSDSIAFIET